MIDIREFRRRYKVFERLDFKNHPHTFYEFWTYKLRVENQDSHILDRANRIETLLKLRPILKIWQWHRPCEFEYCFQSLKKSIKNLSEPYDRIRNFSLTEFDEVPEKDLKTIWNEFGSIKDQGTSRPYGELVMTITKPLMFLWGQTPAFDSVVRAKMPLSTQKGFKNTRWEFNLWIRVMKKLQKYLNNNNELNVAFRKMSKEKYETDTAVPFGQFFDLYYWTEDKPDNGSKIKDTICIEKKHVIDFEKKRQREEYRNLIDLLTKLKSTEKISAVERRDFEKEWRDHPHNRGSLVKKLEIMLNN